MQALDAGITPCIVSHCTASANNQYHTHLHTCTMVVHKTLVLYCACAYECVCNRESSSVSTKVFRSIAVSDVTSMSIVKQCYLFLGTQCTNEVLNNPELPLRDLKRRVLEADRLKTIEKTGNHPSLTYVLP